MRDLAVQVAKDGEGLSKFVTFEISGAENWAAARRIGLACANSPLLKSAIFGEDPNWGRVVMAIGKAGEAADRDKLVDLVRADTWSPATASEPPSTRRRRWRPT